jgi:hypothetical protein
MNDKRSHRFLRSHFEDIILSSYSVFSSEDNILNKIHVNVKIGK